MKGRQHQTAAILGALVVLAAATMGGCSTSSTGASTEMAPEVSGVALDGVRVSLTEYRGKPVVLAFMASW